MWIMDIIPSAFFYAAVIIGIIGFAVGCLPIVSAYRLPIQLVAILLIVCGAWFAGRGSTAQEYKERVAEANAKAKLAEEKAAAATAKVEYVFLDRIKTVKDVQVIVQERIKDVSVKIDENCKVIPEVISIHNQAARAVK